MSRQFKLGLICVAGVAALRGAPAASAQAPAGKPDACIDLRTAEGVALVRGQWRGMDASIVEVEHRAPGADLKPTGAPIRTNGISPHAGGRDYDDSSWTVLEPTGLEARRGGGRLSFTWYRIGVTIPERVGATATAGSTIVLDLTVDDYAEVWVDGALPQEQGSAGGQVIGGWNAPNRVVLTRDARPGQRIQVAVLGINGPISDEPANYIWVRGAVLDIYRPERARLGREVETRITRVDPALDAVIAPGTRIEKIAEGFGFTEGPVWVRGTDGAAGSLLFSDPNNNTIYRWSSLDGRVTVFRSHSGYSGFDIGEYGQPGSNGLTLDREGRLTICEHGNRRVTRLEKNGTVTVLADRFGGRRLNSPNDLVYRSDGTLYFTDPPFGLPKAHSDARREQEACGVYCLYNGTLRRVAADFTGPNGLAFSPDEKHLYVDNWEVKRKTVYRYDVAADGTLSGGTLFFDMTGAPGEEALDGLKTDLAGNVYVSGPGGVWIISAAGRHLGTINGPELPANFAWGDEDGKTLYLTARTGVYRVRMLEAGVRP